MGSGHRLTLTYELTAVTSGDKDTAGQRLRVSEDAARGCTLFAALTRALEDPAFLPDGAYHMYALMTT